jgi:branched-chain amino acid transport system substrate-binding protein
MIAFLILFLHVLVSPFRTRARLEAEIVMLRHQLNVLRRRVPSKPKLTVADRLLFVWLYRLFPPVLDAITNGTVLTAMLMDVPTVRAIGLDQGQGLYYSNTFYWDRTDGTRAFTKRLTALNNGTYPSQNVAGAYSAVLHYLKAVAALGVAKAKSDGRAVVARMKATPYDDPVFGQGTVRAEGRMMNPTYLFQVKRPTESRSEWDCSILAAAVAPDECIRPLAEGTCEMAKG